MNMSFSFSVRRVIVFAALAVLASPLCGARDRTVVSPQTRYQRLTIGVLLGNSITRKLVARYVPEFTRSAIPRDLRDRPLNAMRALDPSLTKTVLRRAYAALAAIPVTSSAAEVSPPPPDGPTNIPDAQLDPARHLMPAQLEGRLHAPLPEQYIWTYPGRKASGALAPRYFRQTFRLRQVPRHATLYVTGPRQAKIFINGREIGHYQTNLNLREIELVDIGIRVYQYDVTRDLRRGRNVIAIEAERGPTAYNEAISPISRHFHDGTVLAVMIVPAARGIQAPPVLMSDAGWRAKRTRPTVGWQTVSFNDSAWRKVDDFGGIESAVGLYQGNTDAGMYAWPGYQGIAPFLAQYHLRAVEVRHVYEGVGKLRHIGALTDSTSGPPFTVSLPATRVSGDNAPELILDFGREVSGRLELVSESDAPARVTVQYGESTGETILQPFLGDDPIYIPPHGTAYGPKSGFRYALIRFTGGRVTRFRKIFLDGIAYPVRYKGSFESSSRLLNKMWAIGAYTAHLCMQDGVWDGVKRDRNRWAGDLDVSGRTIDDVFGTHFLMQETLNKLLGPAPVDRDVNGIPGYSAFWVNDLFNYYLHTGAKGELHAVHGRLVQLLNYMIKDVNQQGLFSDLTHGWPFVDWAPGLYGYDRNTRMATQFEFYQAFKDGAYLLRVVHDERNAKRMAAEAATLKAAALKYMLGRNGAFGSLWQPNAYAVLSGLAQRKLYPNIWHRVLSQVGTAKFRSYVITPYYNYYVVSAMARMGHRVAALNWIRQYWGGMVEEGATSFWEGYSPAWLKGFLFQKNLQADANWGFHVSLAHGWASGVTPWLMRQILGIRPTAGGFRTVTVRPDLLGLKWAKGGEPTPHGVLRVSIVRRGHHDYTTILTLPADETARMSIPVPSAQAVVWVNSKEYKAQLADDGRRAVVTLRGQGTYVLTAGPESGSAPPRS